MTLRAKAGTTISFFATVYQDGTPTNAGSFGDVNVYDAASGGSIVTNGSALTPTALGSGVYQVDWAIAEAQAAGTYYPEWDFTSGGQSPTVRSTLTILGAGTTVRELILADIKSTLESVSTANGYKTAVDTTEPVLKSRDEIPEGKRPYIGFGPDRETYEHMMGNTMRVQMPFTVVGYIGDEVDWATASGEINDIRDDIIAAIMEDPTMGGNCTQVLVLDDLTDEADPNRRDISDDGGAVVVNFRVTYYRDTASS